MLERRKEKNEQREGGEVAADGASIDGGNTGGNRFWAVSDLFKTGGIRGGTIAGTSIVWRVSREPSRRA
jgi:hypothetical protein